MKRGAKDEKLLEKLTTDQANSASLMARKFFRFFGYRVSSSNYLNKNKVKDFQLNERHTKLFFVCVFSLIEQILCSLHQLK